VVESTTLANQGVWVEDIIESSLDFTVPSEIGFRLKSGGNFRASCQDAYLIR
jgi:hypothetical protein